MSNQEKKSNPLKKAHKTLKFWYEAMLLTDLMNDKEHRVELKQALETVKNYAKKDV